MSAIRLEASGLKKRISLDMMLLAVTSVLLVSTALCLVFYRQFSASNMREIRNRAETFADNTSQTAIEALAITKSSDMRVTVIAPDGTVVFDNTVSAGGLPNHGGRQEISDAFVSGFGQSTRHSDTLGTETVYYAIRLTDGYVLRTSKTASSILGVFAKNLPVVVCIVFVMVIISYVFAGKLTKRIVAPLIETGSGGVFTAAYDELSPFVRTIAAQRESIAGQMADLQHRSEIIGTIMDNMNEGIILTDSKGIILSANNSVLKILEKDFPIDGKNTLEILRDTDFSAFLQKALDGGHGETSLERGGRTYRLHFSHVSGGGAIVLFLDTTERAAAEKMRREFSANVSHELKTPLTSIYAGAEMLAGGIVKETDKEKFYNDIKNEAGRLITLIEDILMISRLDEGGGRESFESVNLAAVAKDAADALSMKAEKNKITVKVTGQPVNMAASRSLIYEMFYNLLDNAIKYNKTGGMVTIDVSVIDSSVRIAVKDTGIGIPKESQSRVFERFYRVDKSRSKKTGGTGLGLAIVKHIALVHGGKIELESMPDAGTTVVVSFDR